MPRPPHPAPNVRDDRETPLCVGRDGNGCRSDLGEKKTKIFLQERLDRRSVICPTGYRNACKLFRAPQFSGEPPDRFGLDRVRYRVRFGVIAFGAFKRSMFETFGPRRYAFQFHSPLTSRTPRALNWSDQ
jgi:hypothetical protein